jgi:hypothetical protein
MNQARKFPLSLGEFLCLVFFVRAWGHHCAGVGYSHCTDRWAVQRGKVPLALSHPIGASSISVGKGSPEGNSVPLGGRFPKEGSAFLGTRLSLGKSSVLYLCFRLTPERGWPRYLRLGQMGSGPTLFGVSRAGGFCTATDEIGICAEGKIRLTGKGIKGISTPVLPQ